MTSIPHILVVEDDPLTADILQALLQHGGFSSEVAASGAAALEWLERRSCDAILLDLSSPNSGGTRLIGKVRAVADAPILVISEEDEEDGEDELVRALDAGADDFLAKPFQPAALLARIRAALRRPPAVDRGAA